MDQRVPSVKNASILPSPPKSPNAALASDAVVTRRLRHIDVPASDTCHSAPVARTMSVFADPTKLPKTSCETGCMFMFKKAQPSRPLLDHCHPVEVARITLTS